MVEFEVEALARKGTMSGRSHIVYENLEKLQSQLGFIADDTKLKVNISLYDEKKEKEKLRTIAQNKYYHLLLDIICDHTGDMSHHDMHRKLKRKFLGVPYIEEDKEYIEVPSTTGMSPKKFGEYLEKIFVWASEEEGLVLPSSDKYY